MLGVTSGSLRNSSVAVWEENSPHCWWGGCICVCELWENCPAHTKSHVPSPLSVQLRGTGADGAGAHSDSKTGSGEKKTSLWGLICFLWMDCTPHAGCQSISSMELAQLCPAQRGAFARLLFSRNTWKGHPVALPVATELKNSQTTGGARTCPIHSFPEVFWE